MPLRGQSAALDRMLRDNMPLTREVWMGMAFPFEGDKPDPWTAEDEAQVPAPFQQALPGKSPS
jgi:hypothetical protein